MTQYRLNESLLFDDETFQISRLSSARAPVKLSATATRCLRILIEHQGETVDKDRLIHEGWGQFGMLVTEGSMWKNISQLRQGFQKLQVPFEVIITVPRLGYTFSSQMSVERVEPMVRAISDPTQPTSSVEPASHDNDEAEIKQIQPLRPEPTQTRHVNRRFLTVAVTLVVINLLAATGYIFWMKQSASLSAFDAENQYERISPQGITQMFVQIPFSEKTAYVQDAVTRFVHEQPKTSSGMVPNYVYINKVTSRSVSSYFLCDQAITSNKNGCTAYFSLKGEAAK